MRVTRAWRFGGGVGDQYLSRLLPYWAPFSTIRLLVTYDHSIDWFTCSQLPQLLNQQLPEGRAWLCLFFAVFLRASQRLHVAPQAGGRAGGSEAFSRVQTLRGVDTANLGDPGDCYLNAVA